MRIYLDVTGGDFAPAAPVAGAVEALRAHAGLEIILAGYACDTEALLANCADVRGRIIIDDVTETITNHEAPVLAVRVKKNSAIVKGMLSVKDANADGFVSAGSTGGVLAGAMLKLGRIPGIERPALAPLMPNGKGYFLLIDCGANVDCKPFWLPQFGLMGSAYMQCVMGIADPRVGLINIGAEAEKGNQLIKDVYPLMENAPFHFIGNVEARDITSGCADVLVSDGFSGNIVLKFMEGVASTLMGIIKTEIMADTRGKIGGLILRPAFKRVAKTLDYTEVGGAPLLGVKGAVVKAHGSSNAHAIACAIKQAMAMISGDVTGMIQSRLAGTAPSERDDI